MFTQSGLPIIYSGDEIGQLNDYGYHDDENKREDSRYLHRGAFDWTAAAKRTEKGSIQNRLYEGLKKLEAIRKEYEVFDMDADVSVIETWEKAVLGIKRTKKGKTLIALFNFSENEKTAWIHEDGVWTDLVSGKTQDADHVCLEPFGMRWLYTGDI